MLNEAKMATIGANKTKMINAVEEMLNIVDQYYGHELQRELERLLDALNHSNEDELSEVIADTVDGCASPTSQIRDLGYAMDRFEQAQHNYEQVFRDAIDAYENN